MVTGENFVDEGEVNIPCSSESYISKHFGRQIIVIAFTHCWNESSFLWFLFW